MFLDCLTGAGAACAAASCAPGSGLVVNPSASGAKGDTFGYRKWLADPVDPDVVIIGIHGFCGASIDYRNLGTHLLRHQPRTALYAYELRGQGGDPIHARRGDIGNPREWYDDLLAFTGMVRDLHADAKIVWFGESMGALIAAHAYRESAGADAPPCDGLVFSSPIVRFRDDIPAWTPGLVQVAATALPLARVSLDTLAGGEQVQMTQHSIHGEQVKKNEYHVDQHTLRLIGTLTWLINGMNTCAGYFQVPVLVLHADKDYFNNDADVRGFVARIPESTHVTYKNYLNTYHLLMYDAKRESVFRDVRGWVDRLRRGRLKNSRDIRHDST
jgi:alpha-beta hydrolase superfamily lysophospholipase